MEQEIDPTKLMTMRKRIMELERTNAFTNQYTNSQIQKKIRDIVEEVAFNDN